MKVEHIARIRAGEQPDGTVRHRGTPARLVLEVSPVEALQIIAALAEMLHNPIGGRTCTIPIQDDIADEAVIHVSRASST